MHISINQVIFFAPLLVSLIMITAFKIQLKNFQALYLLLSAALIALTATQFTDTSILVTTIIGILIGEVLHFTLVGLMGDKIKISNHESMLAGIGLFPYAATQIGNFMFYIFLFFVICMFYAGYKLWSGSRKYGLKWSEAKTAQKKLSEEDFKGYTRATSAILSVPFLLSALIVILTLS